MRDKKIIANMLAVICAFALCGCGDEIPELSAEQTELITEYSAALLLKYDSNTPSRLLPEGSVVPITYVDPGSQGAVSAETVPDTDEGIDIPVDSEPEFSSDEMTVTDATTGETTGASAHPEGFAGFLEGTGLDISYTGNYEVVDSYPEGDEVNPYFTVDATTGNKLLVLHFALTNVSGEDSQISLGALNLRYRVSLNGGKNKFVMTTLLENDILSYSGTIPAGQQADIVAVTEISEAEASDIQTIDFTIRGDSFTTSISLQ